MITHPLLHFVVGTVGSLVIYLLLVLVWRRQRFSLPVQVVLIGIICASLSHYLTPWATPVVLVLYAILAIREEV